MKIVRAALIESVGEYFGQGVNHEGQTLKGTFSITPVLDGRGFRVNYRAVGIDGSVFHQEDSLIAPSTDGKPVLWNFNTNTPGLLAHGLNLTEETPDSTRFTFSVGDPANPKVFRMAVALTRWADGDVSYVYSWGLPGGEFVERSGLKMRKLIS